MTTYNTGNPLGSSDPRDLYDNAENLDEAANSSADTFQDRLGKSRLTWAGMENQFDADQAERASEFNTDQADRNARFSTFIASSGYQFLGDYASGIEITEYNQIVRDGDGEFWRVSGQVELPYTTTGAGLPEDDALTPVGDAALRQQLAAPDGVSLVGGITFVTPEMFGAKGDGTTVDSEAFDSMVSAAGEGGVIHLSPDKVYLVDRPIYMLDYQTIVGNNATLRRVDQVVTTTTTPMSSEATTVSLDSVEGFKVGQRVAFAQVGVARGLLVNNTTMSTQRTITNISGNTITVNSGPRFSLNSGSTCFLAFNTLTMREQCKVSGVIFDGNRSNWSFNRWEVICELDTNNTTFGQLATNNLFVDSPSEAIVARSHDAVYSHNRFKDINGNAFHTSSAENNLIIGNHGVNGNLDMDVGHQDGFVSISLQNFNITIVDNIASQFVSGVSPISIGSNPIANANFIVSDNQFRDMYCWGIGGVTAPNVTITGNILDNIPTDPSKKPETSRHAPIYINASGKYNATVSGNIVTNTLGDYSMHLGSETYDPTQQSSLKVFGNIMDGAVIVGGQDIQIQQNSIGGMLRILNCRRFTAKDNTILYNLVTSGNGEYIDVVVEGNSIMGGTSGVSFGGTASSYENITVKNNVLTGQTDGGISLQGSGPAINGVWITDNVIVAGDNALSSFSGIRVSSDGIAISGNKISAQQTISSGYGIRAGGASTNYTNLTITGNEVRGDWLHTIFLHATSTGVTVAHNTLQGKDVTGPVGNAETYNVVF